jgi:DNA-binding CsgD family transcriptional regulator
MVTQENLDIQPLALVAAIAEELCSLPAVATFGWMKRAARSIAKLHPEAVTTVALAHYEEDGWSVPRDFTASLGSGRLSSTVAIVDGLLRDLASESVDEHFAACQTGRPVLGRTNLPGGVFTPTRMMLRDRLHPTRLTMLYPMTRADGMKPERILCVDLYLPQAKGRFSPGAYLTLEAVLPLLGRRVQNTFTDIDHTVELSPREGEVLRLLQQGLTVKQIAQELQRSPHTVHDHVKSLHRKVGACNRGELLAKTFGLFEKSLA